MLHIAIVNEDPSMVKYLLDSGADVHERCFGNFMCPEDQKASRLDSLDHEWVSVAPVTDYSGYFRTLRHVSDYSIPIIVAVRPALKTKSVLSGFKRERDPP